VILAIREGVRVALEARGYPVKVTCGSLSALRLSLTPAVARIGIEYDRNSRDDIRGPVGTQRNPNRVFARFPQYRARVLASETRAGALAVEHDAECNRFADALMVALRDWAQAEGASLEIVDGGLVPASDVQGAEVMNMSVYELFFRMGRSVDRKNYDGSAQLEGAVGSASTTTRVTLDEQSFEEVD